MALVPITEQEEVPEHEEDAAAEVQVWWLWWRHGRMLR